MIDPARLRQLAANLGGHRILVVGDVCLDEYIVGWPERLSREAPVPVLAFSEAWTLPGAAANPALNVVALGSQAAMLAVVGDDATGDELLATFAQRGIATDGIARVAGAITSRKTRFLARSAQRLPQQLLRLDRSDGPGGRDGVVGQLAAGIAARIDAADAVLVSDYRRGIVNQAMIDAVRDAAQRHARLATVDSQGDLFRFTGFAVVKANREEAERSLHAELPTDAAIAEHGRRLLASLDAQSVVITRGSAGLSVVDPGGVAHFPATNLTEVYDVTGAGDTVIAVMTLALAAGGTVQEAACLANAAAGLVVRRLGNATITRDELLAALPL